MEPFEIPGIIRYGLVPGYIRENRSFYGVDTIAAEWELRSETQDLGSLILFLKHKAAERHHWPHDLIWFEHTPRNALACLEFLRYFPQSHFIHLVRDGRDSVFSQWRRFRTRFKLLSGEQAWELAVTLYVLLDARAQEAKEHPGYLKIHFDDLVGSPLRTVNQVLRHVGLETVSSEEFSNNRKIAPHELDIDDGKRTWQADPNQAIRKDVVGAWGREAPISLLEKFSRHPISLGNGKISTLDEQLARHGYTA